MGHSWSKELIVVGVLSLEKQSSGRECLAGENSRHVLLTPSTPILGQKGKAFHFLLHLRLQSLPCLCPLHQHMRDSVSTGSINPTLMEKKGEAEIGESMEGDGPNILISHSRKPTKRPHLKLEGKD